MAPDLSREDQQVPEGFAEFVARAEALLSEFAREHAHEHTPLLREDRGSAESR